MAAGLLLSGLANLAFSQTTSLGWLALIWALNGWFQSMGFPAGARLLSTTTSRNSMAAVGPSSAAPTSWARASSWWQAVTSVCWAGGISSPCPVRWRCSRSAGVVVVLRDVPHRNPELLEAVPEPRRPALRAGLSRIVTNRYIWAVAIGNLFLYIVRYGLLTWSASFLIANRGMSTVSAGWMVGIFELAGLGGGLSAGWISDIVSKGRRGPVMALYMLLLTAAIAALWFAPAGSKPAIGFAMAACGFFVYGPLMLVSVAAAGYAGRRTGRLGFGAGGLFRLRGRHPGRRGHWRHGRTRRMDGWFSNCWWRTSLLSAICFACTARRAVAAPIGR